MPVGDDDFRPRLQPALPTPVQDDVVPSASAPALALRLLGGTISLRVKEETELPMNAEKVVNISTSGTTRVYFKFLDANGDVLVMTDVTTAFVTVMDAPGGLTVDVADVVPDLLNSAGYADIEMNNEQPGDYVAEVTLRYGVIPDQVDRITESFIVKAMRRLQP